MLGGEDPVIEHKEPDHDVKKTESHNDKSHHSAAAEGYLKTVVQRYRGSLGSP